MNPRLLVAQCSGRLTRLERRPVNGGLDARLRSLALCPCIRLVPATRGCQGRICDSWRRRSATRSPSDNIKWTGRGMHVKGNKSRIGLPCIELVPLPGEQGGWPISLAVKQAGLVTRLDREDENRVATWDPPGDGDDCHGMKADQCCPAVTADAADVAAAAACDGDRAQLDAAAERRFHRASETITDATLPKPDRATFLSSSGQAVCCFTRHTAWTRFEGPLP